tara:strand:- start:732 stop:1043 length:312 start_codon:yes stop_codon:yes gene_type:complete
VGIVLFGGTPTMLNKNGSVGARNTSDVYGGSIITDEDNVMLSKNLLVKDRNILNELDKLHQAMLLLPRDQKLEDKYPELKEAYDAYQELYREILLADKMREVR